MQLAEAILVVLVLPILVTAQVELLLVLQAVQELS
jgi:hypothetical protein